MKRPNPDILTKCALLLLVLPVFCIFLCLPHNSSASPMLVPHGQTMRVLPFLDYHIEDAVSVDIEEMAVLGQTNAFQPFDKFDSPFSEGILWLRFTLAPLAADMQAGTYLLDMGSGIPGRPILYVPTRNELSGALEWRENTPAQRDILLMPEQGRHPVTCYIRLDGLPGPWFDPVIRSPQNAATNWTSLSHTGASLALGIVMLLCLLRGLNENGQWRIWTGLFIFFALIQNILGIPAYGQSFSLSQTAAAMTPGLALMTLPHAARHLLKTAALSRNLDYQLVFLSILGGCFAIAPLAPGLGWLGRWLELWPLLIACFIPTALGIWMSGLRGSRAFLLACLIPPLFTVSAWLGIDFGFSPAILSSLPSWGVALCGLFLIAMPVNNPGPTQEKKAQKNEALSLASGDGGIINLEHPLNDPNLRIHDGNITQDMSAADRTAHPISLPKALNSREGAMRRELDTLLRETSGLGQCALPPASRMYAENIIASANTLASIVTNPDYHEEQDSAEPARENFNLQSVIRSVHDAAAPIAEHAGLSLSWYMPPFLPQEYFGDADQLAHVLSLLVDSAIRGTTRGNIKLSVRRVPESHDPGHLLFTVSDTGDGAPPLRRSSVALAKTWEFSSRHNGFLGMESGPGGLSIAFSAHLAADAGENPQDKRRINVIVAGNNRDARSKLASYVEEIPCNVMEAASIEEALKRQRAEPVNLLVATDNEARPAIGDIIAEFARLGKTAGFKAVYILAITPDESQWSLLKASGFTHAMTEPVDREAFKLTINKLVLPPPDTLQENSATPGETPPQSDQDTLLDLMDTFYSASSDIIANKAPLSATGTAPEKKAEAPQMLDEQEFDLSQTFEGPDWLETPQEKEPERENAPESKENDAEMSENGAEVAAPQEKDDARCDETQPSGSEKQPRQLTDVWISEPMPMPQQDSEAKKPASQTYASEERAPAEENKGEPVRPAGQNVSMMDFIVSVNNASEKENPTTQTLQNEKNTGEETAPANAVATLITQLDTGLAQARQGFADKNCDLVEEATAAMAKSAEDYGYRIVGRLARCVERAAKAKDLPALGDLLPVLADAVERNRIASTSRK